MFFFTVLNSGSTEEVRYQFIKCSELWTFFLTNGWNQIETNPVQKEIERKMGTRNKWESEENIHNCKPEDL